MTTIRTSYRTAEQATTSLKQAAAALRDHLGGRRDAGDSAESWTETTRMIDFAMAVDGITAAQIAVLAGVRQLVVTRYVVDPRRRAAALVAARHDADRYSAQVRDAIRQEALRRWRQSNGRRGGKTQIAVDLGITRVTLDAWISEMEQAELAKEIA